MTKTEIVEQMATDAGISKAAAETAFRSCIDSITNSLKKRQELTIAGFWTFSVTSRAARTGRNPQTGEPIGHLGGPHTMAIEEARAVAAA